MDGWGAFLNHTSNRPTQWSRSSPQSARWLPTTDASLARGAGHGGAQREKAAVIEAKAWEDLRQLAAGADRLLSLLALFLDTEPPSAHYAGAALLAALEVSPGDRFGALESGAASPMTRSDPFVAKLESMRAAAPRAAEMLALGRGHPGRNIDQLVEEASKLLPVGAGEGTRNAFLDVVFELCGVEASKGARRGRVYRQKRYENDLK